MKIRQKDNKVLNLFIIYKHLFCITTQLQNVIKKVFYSNQPCCCGCGGPLLAAGLSPGFKIIKTFMKC